MSTPERFVDASVAAEYLSVKPRHLMDLTRAGVIPGHPLGIGTKRRVWRYRLSELEESLTHNAASFADPVVRRTYRHRQSPDTENGQ